MEFTYHADIENQKVKFFLKRHHVSKRLLSKIKFNGGEILVNGKEENAVFRVKVGDIVKIITPDEPVNDELIAEETDLKILYEDEDYLLINKPYGIPSITGLKAPTGSMCNYVAGYFISHGYPNKTVHLATRLDRDTSGIMIFAKHSFAHSILKTQNSDFTKKYYAIVKWDENLAESGVIDAPIGRAEGSIIERRVRFDGLLEAKSAKTSYQLIMVKNGLALLDVTLHTGRTHQIRVHLAYIGYPLLGDDLYGGDTHKIQRQALHCHYVRFDNHFRENLIEVDCGLPEDLICLLESGIKEI
ncbi:RluA family pseudouridine synthase [Lactovum miscens]|uniref:Pseudouridine synthase n=1 Tax=Lactovum miscens TaxID=190387 RepID=A0A841C6Y6_9LACT|nr:RluA family pseudouridine synthase [Lactovum miscens]MBB5888104.1 23S rRNA pseudouridine1911/1915/1917 synthase [Lactovum miscens]